MNKKENAFHQTRWSLDDLYPSSESPQFQQSRQQLEGKVAEFEKVRGELQADIGKTRFLEIIALLEEILKLRSRLGAYAELWFAEDTQNQNAQTLVGQIQQLDADIENRVLFFSLWWKESEGRAGQAITGWIR